MRIAALARTFCLPVWLASAALVSAAIGQDYATGAEPSSQPERSAADVRPGEIVIRRTGTRRVVTPRPATQPAATDPVAGRDAESSYDRPGPRNVTIGYFMRDPMETGWGAQVYAPSSPFLPSYADVYGYGYGSCLPSYGYGGYGGCRTYGGFGSYGGSFGSYRSYGSSFGGRSSYSTRSAPITYARRAR